MRVQITNSYGYSVEVIADSYVRVDKSLNPLGYHRITSIVCVFPRPVNSEVNTHRDISKNSASSRAIPVKRMIDSVTNNPFIPDKFPLTHSGMQAKEYILDGTPEYETLKSIWLNARDRMVAIAQDLNDAKISKQLTNRFIEAVLMHKVIMTATEWENAIALRAHQDAQNEMQILFEMILEALNQSEPTELKPGEWHVPFGEIYDQSQLESTLNLTTIKTIEELKLMIAIARCARVSYKLLGDEIVAEKSDYAKDLTLYQQLLTSGHWSPFEHVAEAMSMEQYTKFTHTFLDDKNRLTVELGRSGNFRGFIQYRKKFPRTVEIRSENRLKKLNI